MSAAAQPPANEAYRARVRELMAVTGSLDLGRQLAGAVVQGALQSARATGQEISPEAARIVQETAQEFFARLFSAEQVLELQSAIYAKHFTQAELEQLLDFYRTPLGTKMIHSMPQILAEGIAVGQAKAAAAIPEFEAELERRLQKAGALP